MQKSIVRDLFIIIIIIIIIIIHLFFKSSPFSNLVFWVVVETRARPLNRPEH